MLFQRKPGLVSIIVTCYNIEPYIEDCLTSLLNQTYKNIEVIIVNDASLDRSADKVRGWIKKNKPAFPVELINLPRNTGFSGALTTGYFLSSGEYIAVQDGDDLSHPQRIEKQVEFLQENQDTVLVGTNYKTFLDGNFDQQKSVFWLKYGEDIPKVYWNGGHCVCHGTIMFRGETFDQLGGPTRRIKGAEDYEFIAKCLNAKLKINNIRDVLYYYREHSKQRSRKFFGKGSKE
ncbi:glycosyltransferase family 2 protein [Fictibacillus fluitans]|uniref:Glycosyltransferase family 2 protein n=1 Tax=Fictibacillus fluitans TaxID=3058422 RepID=A0ABT8HQJ7_9BACL|nr:glycosyltransferase family 2 protein [Fictibacillus sp. NE201]MDN4523031.1 glycosyltransferase family 2 protein [Fictibacillus sp. NE201]